MCTKYCQLRKVFSWLTASFAVLILSFNTAVAQNLADFSHGRHNICAIDTDGNLECTTFDDPAIYLPPDDGTLYTDVSSGSDHSCAITQAGELRCWGLNNLGQLDAPTSSVGFVSVVAGENHSCAIDTNMQAHCWGLNINGQTDVSEPNAGFVSLHLGSVVSCGIQESGDTVCWTTTERISNTIPDNPNYSDVVAGFGNIPQSCGLTQDGFIDCWTTEAIFNAIPDGGPYSQIELTDRWFCGLTLAGQLDCSVRTTSLSSSLTNLNLDLLNEAESLPPLSRFEIKSQTSRAPSICGLTLTGELICIGSLPAVSLPGSEEIPPVEGLRFEAYSDSTIELFWNLAFSRFGGSNVYRDGELLAFTSNTASFIDDSLLPDQEYVYTVARVNFAGNEGPLSDPLLVSTSNRGQIDTGTSAGTSLSHPGQPTNLNITRYGEFALEIFWDRPVGVFGVSYQIFRNGEFLAFAPGPSYFDDSVNPETDYHYTVVVEGPGDDVVGVGFVNEPALN